MGINEDIKQSKFKSEMEKSIVNLIFTSNWLNEQHHKIFKPYGLTTAQYNVLRILRGQHPNAATVNLIIDRMLDRMSNVSRIVDKLVIKDLVSRKQNKDDRRAVDVIITQKGLDLLAELDDVTANFQKETDVFTEEEKIQFNSFLDKFRNTNP